MTLTPEKIREMREARRMALFERWGAGERLKDSELGEIADLIALASAEPSPPPPAEPAAGESVADMPPLVLEAPSSEKSAGPAGCRHPIVPGSPYETIYAAKIRTIKNWRRVGREADPPDPPPLDEEWKMAAWWRRHMERRVPPRLEELERKGPPAKAAAPVAAGVADSFAGTEPGERGSGNAAPAVSPPDAEVEASAPAPSSRPPSGHVSTATETEPLATGYAATLARFERAEAIAAKRYFDAYESPDEDVRATASRLKKEWDEMANTYRAYARDSAKILRDAGAVWDAAAAVAALTDIHNVLAPGIRRLLKRFRDHNPDFAAALDKVAPYSAQQEAFLVQVDLLFEALGNSSFTSSTFPAPAEPSEPPPLEAAA